MSTFKKLGLKMTRSDKGGWRVFGKDFEFSGTGNKGEVMNQFLRENEEKGTLIFLKTTGWVRNNS